MKKSNSAKRMAAQPTMDKNRDAYCINKWKTLLEAKNAAPIQDYRTLASTAVVLENQLTAIKEAANNSSVWGNNATFGGSLTQGDTYAKGDNRLPNVILPMIRRAFPELIAHEVVGVQPMTGPIGLAFAMRYRYDQGPLHEARSSGTLTNPPVTGPSYGVDSYRNNDTANPPAPTDMRQLGATVNGAGTELGYNYLDNTYSGRRNDLYNRTLNPATNAPWTDAEIVLTWNTANPGDTVSDYAALVTKALTNTSAQALINSCSLGGGHLTFSDQDLGAAALLGDYEATGRIPRAKFTFEKKAVEAGTRRIGSSWSLELEQDIKNMNGIDINNEITSMLSYELTAEIDREMEVRMLYAALSANEFSYWNAAKADARWMGERDRVFYQYVIQMSNRMAVRNRRGPANFIIATPDVCSLFETLPQYAIMSVNGTVNTNQTGVAKVGTLGDGRFTVYRDTRTPVQNNSWINNQWDNQGQYTVGGVPRTQGIPDFCLLGYKGSEYWDAGILYCPYIPIMMQRVVDPVSFEPSIGLITRYGVVDNLYGANLYFHCILVDTFTTVLPPAASPANTFPGRYPNTSALGVAEQQGGYPIVDVTPTP